MATVTKAAALALFSALGLANADKWNAKRLAAKLGKVDEMVDEKTKIEDKAVDKTLTTVLKAIAANEEVTVADEAAAPAAAPAPTAAKGKKAPAAPAAETPAEGMAKAAAAKKKAATAAAPKEPAKPTIPGVRSMATRPYLAGKVIAKHGLEAGLTDEMTKELDELFGRANPTESEGRLAGGWHSIRGYLDAMAEAKKKGK